jgi:hypothetical protein
MNTVAVALYRVRAPLLLAAVLVGCNRSAPTDASPSTKSYTQADLETDIADTAELNRIVWATIADEKLPGQIAMSFKKAKPDEAIATIEYGDEPKQKKVLTLKKSDGKWTVQQP